MHICAYRSPTLRCVPGCLLRQHALSVSVTQVAALQTEAVLDVLTDEVQGLGRGWAEDS